MEKTPLTEEERGNLSNIERFNATLGRADWLFRDRIVREVDLAGIELDGAGLENVHFDGIDISGGVFRSTRMTGVNFHGGSLRETLFEDVEFTRCEFVHVNTGRATFRHCTFRLGMADAWIATGVRFEDCVFEEFPIDSLTLKDSSIERTRFEQSELTGIGFYKTRLDDVTFENSKVKDATFSKLEVTSLVFRGGTITDSGFGRGTYDKVRFEGCEITEVAFQSVELGELQVVDSEKINGLTFDTCQLERPVLSGCKTTNGIMFVDTKIDGIQLNDGLHYFLELVRCTVTGQNAFKGLTISGLRIANSKIEGVRMVDVSLQDILVLDDVYFKNLRLKDVDYRDLELNTTSVQYINSDKFEPPRR